MASSTATVHDKPTPRTICAEASDKGHSDDDPPKDEDEAAAAAATAADAADDAWSSSSLRATVAMSPALPPSSATKLVMAGE